MIICVDVHHRYRDCVNSRRAEDIKKLSAATLNPKVKSVIESLTGNSSGSEGIWAEYEGVRYSEADISRKYADAIIEVLRKNGHIVYTNEPELEILTGNYYQRHVQALKEFKANLYISCHAGYHDPPIPVGFVLFKNEKSRDIAVKIADGLQRNIPEYRIITFKATKEHPASLYLNRYGANVLLEPFLVNQPGAMESFIKGDLCERIARGLQDC